LSTQYHGVLFVFVFAFERLYKLSLKIKRAEREEEEENEISNGQDFFCCLAFVFILCSAFGFAFGVLAGVQAAVVK